MKYIMNIFAYALLMGIVVCGINIAHAETAPDYMKDAVITVKTKDGKEYTFSGNEYKVVKRGQSAPVMVGNLYMVRSTEKVYIERQTNHKHIISLEAVHSKNGFSEQMTSSTVEVKSRKELGVGFMYQNNFYEDHYIGGRIDSNGGAGLNLGIGF